MREKSKFQPGEEMFDDVAGHAVKSGRALPAEDAEGDVEGHGFRGNVTAEDGDVEGHGFRVTAEDDGDGDVEGHGVRVRV